MRNDRVFFIWGMPFPETSIFMLFLVMLFGYAYCAEQDPELGVQVLNRPYLTWQGNPDTAITINWQTDKPLKHIEVRYGTAQGNASPGKYPLRAAGQSHAIENMPEPRWIHSVQLTGLKPATDYYFIFGDGKKFSRAEYRFRTLAADDTPFTFAIGGDMGPGPRTRKLVQAAAGRNPAFVVVGGDIHYENGEPKNFRVCDMWLDIWLDDMVDTSGRLIPMVHAIGNHEVNKLPASEPVEKRAPFFFGYYPQGGKSYYSRDIGSLVRMIVLDSGHVLSHEEQVPWLKTQLESASGIPWIIPVYHVPFYPSHREFEGELSARGRTLWMPLFEASGVKVAFEHHDHTFKRTRPLRAGAVDPSGIVYLGDGCFGREPREIKNGEAWYMEKALSTAHFWVVQVSRERLDCVAVDEENREFDTVSFTR
ncbi:MAG TPA: fibronectin type III domain-containing protein [Candidatus Hydrogenedentes bacterium]|nr:fibronectin type III domain-containing protein [Candidatus Hydrogenedentota bacterium]